jgi:hypothetical protein
MQLVYMKQVITTTTHSQIGFDLLADSAALTAQAASLVQVSKSDQCNPMTGSMMHVAE